MKITMSAPDLSEEERKAVEKVLRSPQLSLGPEIQGFESIMAETVGAKHAIAVNSGTAGLHLCVLAAGVSDGDLVITTPFSFVASSNVILYERAIPIFVDVESETGNIDPEQAAQAAVDLNQNGRIANKWFPRRGASHAGMLKAIMAVDVFGQPAHYDRMQQIVEHYQLSLIEDSSEALGSTYKGRHAGNLADAGVFGFYPNKQITTGEGGVVVTDRDDWAVHIRALRNQGRSPGDSWLQHSLLGYNYRMTEMSAALGRVQLERRKELSAARAKVAGWYNDRLTDTDHLQIPKPAPWTTRMSWFVYVVRLAPDINREEIIFRLEENGIPTRPYFKPIHLQPFMAERFGYREGDYPIAEDLGRRSLALPFSGKMEKHEVDYVCDQLGKALQNNTRVRNVRANRK
jgi:dTDP-4-amino-4,6-dideoxygalactose transaminase